MPMAEEIHMACAVNIVNFVGLESIGHSATNVASGLYAHHQVRILI
jgi:hypothetical protein